jgi:deazaflavin-dependent oxidoreductase (nitroreductase family)
MAKQYEVTTGKRVVSWMMGQAARFGLGDFAVLTTTGRKSGEPRVVTVSPITHDGTEFVVSPYGDSAWVLNLRADPAATLRRGGSERQVTLVEVTGRQDGVVAAYHRREAFARQFMDLPDDPTPADVAATSAQFPVFRVDER